MGMRTEIEKTKMKAAMGLKDLKAELEKAAMLQQIRELQRDLAQIRSQQSSSSMPMLPASRSAGRSGGRADGRSAAVRANQQEAKPACPSPHVSGLLF